MRESAIVESDGVYYNDDVIWTGVQTIAKYDVVATKKMEEVGEVDEQCIGNVTFCPRMIEERHRLIRGL